MKEFICFDCVCMDAQCIADRKGLPFKSVLHDLMEARLKLHPAAEVKHHGRGLFYCNTCGARRRRIEELFEIQLRTMNKRK